MCPACFATVALTVAATASGGALTVFVAKTFGLPVRQAPVAQPTERSR